MKFAIPKANANPATARGNYHPGPWRFDTDMSTRYAMTNVEVTGAPILNTATGQWELTLPNFAPTDHLLLSALKQHRPGYPTPFARSVKDGARRHPERVGCKRPKR